MTKSHETTRYLLVAALLLGCTDVMAAGGAFPRFATEHLMTRNSHSTVTIGPDGHLYATTTNTGGREPRDNGEGEMVREHLGEVWRYQLDPESGHAIGEERLATLPGPVNGFVFDPAATADHLVFYITVLNDRGHMNRLRVKPFGKPDPVIENAIVVDHLGRGGNHGMNNLVFASDGRLYANQGGRTFWGTEEDNHTAAVLAIDFRHPDFRQGAISPQDYTLEEMWGGDAPIQIIATGLRNPHGIVRHSNGEFYVTIHDPPRGPLAVGGPIREEVVSDGPPDLVARLKPGAYYGHVNGNRGEWVSYGGNPTDELDPFEIPEYPIGTLPLPNYDLSLMVGTRRNHCISGIDEYLNGDLLVGYLYARGAEGVNLAGIERFTLDENGALTGDHEFLKGEDNEPIIFQGVMDVFVTERGWIYVANFGRRRGDGGTNGGIELLKPLGGNIPPSLALETPANRTTLGSGESVRFEVVARDYDGDVAEVALIVNGRHEPCVRVLSTRDKWSVHWKQPQDGHYEIRAEAIDDQGKRTTTRPIFVRVNPDVQPPEFIDLPDSIAYVDMPYSSVVRAEGVPPVRFSLQDAPAGMSLDETTGRLTWRPDQPGQFAATIVLDNGVAPSASHDLQIIARTARRPDVRQDEHRDLVSGVEYTVSSGPVAVERPAAESGFTDGFTAVPPAGKQITYSGFLRADESGPYVFSIPHPFAGKLTFGSHQVLDTAARRTVTVPLEAGNHAFSLQIDGHDGPTASPLTVRTPTETRSPVKKAVLSRHRRRFGLDHHTGIQPYLRMPQDENDFMPQRLSDTGAFDDTASMTLSRGAIGYDVNSPLWSDGAIKQRWVFLPAGGKITFDPSAPWNFPAGTVFLKHFALGESRQRIETRLTVVKADGTLYGVTYRWRENGEDADLVAEGHQAKIALDDGRNQEWFFPGPNDCMSCHTHASGYVLGFSTRQANREFRSPQTGKPDNQLRTLNHLGLFQTPLNEEEIPGYDRLYHLDDTSASLNNRVRSYLDSNCSHCHTTGGVNANWFADYETELSSLGVVDAKPLNHMGLSGVKLIAPGKPEESLMLLRTTIDLRGYRMPPVGRLKTDERAVEALRQWIAQLSPARPE